MWYSIRPRKLRREVELKRAPSPARMFLWLAVLLVGSFTAMMGITAAYWHFVFDGAQQAQEEALCEPATSIAADVVPSDAITDASGYRL